MVVIAALLLLLPILAILQYNWIGQLSDSEIARMRSTLEASTEHFHDDFDRELGRLNWVFGVSYTRSLDEVANQLALSYNRWANSVDFPELIQSIYWINYNEDKELQLHDFDLRSSRLNKIAWPDDMEEWKDYLIDRNEQQLLELSSTPADLPDPHKLAKRFEKKAYHLLVDNPALLIPVSLDPDIESQDLLQNLQSFAQGNSSYTLVMLNQEYLRETLLPDLFQRHIKGKDHLDYDIMIVTNGRREKTIYSSNPSLSPENFEHPDFETELGMFRWTNWPFAPKSQIVRAYASLLSRDNAVADLLVRQAKDTWLPTLADSFSFETMETEPVFPFQSIAQEVSSISLEDNPDAEMLRNALVDVVERIDSLENSSNNDANDRRHAWMLKVQHQDGSLEAYANKTRNANLALSFGILLILGIATCILYVTSQNASKLATQQMEFVAGVSHELRTPLAVIQSAADNLADGVVKDQNRSRKYGALIGKEGRRLTEMVEQILELAGAQSGRLKYDFRPTNISEFMSKTLSMYKDRINEEKIVVEKDIQENMPEIVLDTRTMQIAISNLVSNAIKYNSDKKWIGLEAKIVQNGKGPELNVTVRDKGIGIKEEELSRIFDQFYRADEVRQAQIHGNGLGLSLVKRTAEAHNGYVSVFSTPGEGSTFTIHIPVDKKADQWIEETR